MTIHNNPLYQSMNPENLNSPSGEGRDVCKKGSDGEFRLNAYCLNTGADRTEVDKLLTRAQGIVNHLKAGDSPTGDKEDVKALMWYAMAQACDHGEEFISGAFRMDDPEGKVLAYLNRSLQGDAYPRISTHMKEHKQPQQGADFESGSLPGGKSTLLFSKVPGTNGAPDTLYFKLEGSGCPPFWKKGFRTKENFHIYCGHAMDYVKTRFKPSNGGVYQSRKEHVEKGMKREYSVAMGDVAHRSKFQKIFLRSKPPKEVAQGLKFGLSEMLRQLEDKEAPALKQEFQNKIDTARERGYQGEIKGDEVLLPSWAASSKDEKGAYS
jgi:hypothetical protein